MIITSLEVLKVINPMYILHIYRIYNYVYSVTHTHTHESANNCFCIHFCSIFLIHSTHTSKRNMDYLVFSFLSVNSYYCYIYKPNLPHIWIGGLNARFLGCELRLPFQCPSDQTHWFQKNLFPNKFFFFSVAGKNHSHLTILSILQGTCSSRLSNCRITLMWQKQL